MRIVRFASQERVDVPDATAMSFLVLGEFRRTVRGVLLGEDAKYVVRGFAVEPQAVPDATVRIRLNPSGVLGFMFGAENLGSRTDYGQVVGGDDSNGLLEGNATVTLDFSGQPVGPYTVQVRFVYTDGTNDNRAFWNETTNVEYIASTDTRHLPMWEARFTGAPSAEWIDLATVNWDGAAVDPGDITDLRNFAFEGALAFSRSTQDGTGGMEDFSRSTDRAANGQNAVYPVLRALGRQIQDLKGANDSGLWDWFSRPYAVPGTTAPLAAQRTKSLRSVDVATFTVGDGTTEWGDFNGTSGLDDCLAFILANTATLPSRVVIVLKSRSTTSSPVFTIGTARTIAKHIEIVGAHANDSGRIPVRNTCAGGTTALTITSAGSLTLRNLTFLTPTNDASTIEVQPTATVTSTSGGFFVAENCSFAGRTTTTTAEYTLKVPAKMLHVSNCYGTGRFRIHDGISGSGQGLGGRIESCYFYQCAFEFCESTNKRCVAGLVIENTLFDGPNTSEIVYVNSPNGLLDIRGARNIIFRNSRFAWRTWDWDCFHGGHLDTAGDAYPTAEIDFESCYFSAPNMSGTPHTADAGNNTTAGTGWAIYIEGDADVGVGGLDKLCEGIRVSRCVFDGADVTGGGGQVDAGAIRVALCARSHIRDNIIKRWYGSNRVRGVWISAPSAVGNSQYAGDTIIEGNWFGEWSQGAAANRLECIYVGSATRQIKIVRNYFIGRDGSADLVIGSMSATSRVIYLPSAHTFWIDDNFFEDWNYDTNEDTGHCIVMGSCTQGHIDRNTFRNIGGWCVKGVSGAAIDTLEVNNNIVKNTGDFSVLTDDGQGFDVSDATSADFIVWSGNVFHFDATTSSPDCIRIGGHDGHAFMGNVAPNGMIDQTGATNMRGYNETPDFNYVIAYT